MSAKGLFLRRALQRRTTKPQSLRISLLVFTAFTTIWESSSIVTFPTPSFSIQSMASLSPRASPITTSVEAT
ncbi:hypothetical protein TSUD_299700 [Trifolium subterraneum]|uniref:Uncharacterized protein n=1 Tax=Trifolium subterraneum TaxID=3900 RepID=A0A2Z6NVB4_TRISU|nr:hypothetical protein TSUD_299700 [Trifolium subterraneum]